MNAKSVILLWQIVSKLSLLSIKMSVCVIDCSFLDVYFQERSFITESKLYRTMCPKKSAINLKFNNDKVMFTIAKFN